MQQHYTSMILMKEQVSVTLCKAIMIFLISSYPPKKKTSLSAYGGSDTNAIFKSIKERHAPLCSQVGS